ncbi:hypothetical protein [Donghicola tyrosinivorans]|nr:hypothetical protein [Donghicola tyrosinivorans]
MSDLSLDGGIRLPEACKGDRATQVGSTKHVTGGLVLGDGPGERHGVESHLEKCAALILSYRRSTLELRTQVRFEWSDKFGEIHDHYIDIATLQTDGQMIGYAVRPKERASTRYLQELARIRKQAVSQGFLDNFCCSRKTMSARLNCSMANSSTLFAAPIASAIPLPRMLCAA